LELTPATNKLIVHQPRVEETEGGILLPSTDREMQKAEGTVKFVGPDVETVKVGDLVVYGRYAGTEIKDGKDLHVITEDDVLYFKR